MAVALTCCADPAPVFHCTVDGECVLHDRKGFCEADTHFCSLPDATCASGRRYVQFTDAANANVCVVAKTCGGASQECCKAGKACEGSTLTCAQGKCQPCFTQLSVRGDLACVRRLDGTAWCWGDNAFGQLGAGSTNPKWQPVQVLAAAGGKALEGVVEVACGDEHTCARKGDGSVWCWGHNTAGQLGDGTGKDSLVPVAVRTSDDHPVTGISALAAGMLHTCAIREGSVLCWGRDNRGQLGDGGVADRLAATSVLQSAKGPAVSGVVGVAAGMEHTCLVDQGGTVACFGANDRGQLGNGSQTPAPFPAPVATAKAGSGMSMIAQVACGENHSCARKDNGLLWCWGDDTLGQLGDGGKDLALAPTLAITEPGGGPFSGLTSLAAGEGGTCGRMGDGTLWCWGENGSGQLGDGTMDRRTTPVMVRTDGVGTPLSDVAQVGVGSVHACALKTDGSVWCWGANTAGQLGMSTPASSLQPVQVPLACP